MPEETKSPSPLTVRSPKLEDYQSVYTDIMLRFFCADTQGARVCSAMYDLSSRITALETRLQTETDQDFVLLTQRKLAEAERQLGEMEREFQTELSAETHNRLNEFSTTFGGPEFDIMDVVAEGRKAGMECCM